MKLLYMGIDASKGYADFTVLNENKEIVESNYQLDDTREGQETLVDRMEKYFSDEPETVLYAGIESTGGYENHWYDYIKSLGSKYKIKVSRLNPLMVMHSSKADMKRVGTDKMSALNIAECLISHKENIRYDQGDKFYALRRSWTHIRLLTTQKVQLTNQLDSFMYESNPELLSFCNNRKLNWVLKILEKYPTAIDLSKADVKEIAKIPYVTEKTAIELVEASKRTVSQNNDPISGIIIKSLASLILGLEKTIKSLKKEIQKSCNFDEIKILQSFKGMGIDSATPLFVIIEDINRFPSSKKLASFLGVHPVFKESGDKKSGYHMSKRGSAYARQILYMVALSAIRCNPHIKKVYNKHLSKGMSKKAAIGAIMHKITRIVYGMLKHMENYNPKIDLKNSELAAVSMIKTSKPQNQSRRYQSYDNKAPISRKQHKKRMEQEKLQKV